MKLTAPDALDRLRVNGSNLYRAADPGYPGNFSRDSFTHALLTDDKDTLLAQVDFSSRHQGTQKNRFTGEEDGKFHHEIIPEGLRGVQFGEDDYETIYNACDNDALYLLAVKRLVEMGEVQVLSTYRPNIEAAIGYIYNHLQDEVFYEDPAHCGGDKFALRVTYWKDSVLNWHIEEPTYPITYALPHFQNSAALRAIGNVMNRPELIEKGKSMEQAGVERFWRDGHFVTAIDGNQDIIDPPSSDSMHALYFVDPNEIPPDTAKGIETYMESLETKAGYRTGIPVTDSKDVYHTKYVWTHEQAILHAAARLHKLLRAQEVAKRVVPYFNGNFPELIDAEDFTQQGNKVQLWAVGASIYFNNLSRARSQ